jgi:hypothetical protein
MAVKIFKGILGIGGKKKAATAAAPAEQKGPVITQLGGSPAASASLFQRLRRSPGASTIISDKLGN